jgi:hypothetical protein
VRITAVFLSTNNHCLAQDLESAEAGSCRLTKGSVLNNKPRMDGGWAGGGMVTGDNHKTAAAVATRSGGHEF